MSPPPNRAASRLFSRGGLLLQGPVARFELGDLRPLGRINFVRLCIEFYQQPFRGAPEYENAPGRCLWDFCSTDREETRLDTNGNVFVCLQHRVYLVPITEFP